MPDRDEILKANIPNRCDILEANRRYWDAHAYLWFGTTDTPEYGVHFATEDELHFREGPEGADGAAIHGIQGAEDIKKSLTFVQDLSLCI